MGHQLSPAPTFEEMTGLSKNVREKGRPPKTALRSPITIIIGAPVAGQIRARLHGNPKSGVGSLEDAQFLIV